MCLFVVSLIFSFSLSLFDRKKLKQGLASLPQPKNEYNITLPDVVNETQEESTPQKVEDAEDIERKQRRALIEQEEAKMKQRSEVLKRGLPRPLHIPFDLANDPEAIEKSNLPLEQKAEELVKVEMLKIIINDAINFPLPNSPPLQLKSFKTDTFTDAELQRAQELLEKEVEELIKVFGNMPEQQVP
jgi:pre-mRNA-splicing factor CDC5/CEF1